MTTRSPGAVYIRLLKYLRPRWKRMIVLMISTMIFASLSGVTLTLIPPFLHILFESGEPSAAGGEDSAGGSPLIPDAIEKRIDDFAQRGQSIIYRGSQTERLARFCLILAVLILLKSSIEYFSTYQTVYLEQDVLKRMRDELYGNIQLLPMSFFDTQKTGHLISRITNDVTNLRGAVVGGLASVIRNSLMTLIAITIIFYTSWQLSLLTIILVPINAVLITVIGRKLRKRSRRAQERMADITSVLQETISGVRVVKAFGMEDFERKKFGAFNWRYRYEYLKLNRYSVLAAPASEILGMSVSVIILWYGGRLVISQRLDPAHLMMFIGAMLWVVSPIKNLSKLNSVIQEGLASAQRIFDILDIGTEQDRPGGREIEALERDIVYEKVNFSYRDGTPVLVDVDLRVAKGEVVALVGASGAGKSTLADLLPRFYSPDSGRILIDGDDIAEIRLAALRKLMGIVTQETILFNDSVFNNIAYGRQECPREDVVRAAKAANAHEFIEAMPDGYDTEIGDRGVQLSGGQRQRLAIARALLKDPQILILDEATSSLDVESEALVQEAIDRLVEGRTTLVIAHRLSTIKKADRIVVLEKGRIRQVGTHEELIGEEGIYRRLYNLQIRS